MAENNPITLTIPRSGMKLKLDNTSEFKEIQEKYISGESMEYLSKRYKKSTKTLKKYFLKNQIPIRNPKQKILIDINLCLSLYKKLGSVPKVAKILNYNEDTLYREFKRKNITVKPVKKYFFNDSYFKKVDTKDKAYFLGLLYADGCNDSGKNKVRIHLQEEDGYILELFKNKIQSNANLTFVKKDGNRKNQIDFTICSKQMSKDLYKLGCVDRKSLILDLQNDIIPNNLLNHFIRGYFDGDGSVGSYTYKYTNHQFSFIGSSIIIPKLQKILMENCNLNKTSISCKDKNIKTSSFTYSGTNNCNKFSNWLYQDCENLFLKRKKEKFDLIKSLNKIVCG
jgi:hypothetical protein